MSDPQFTALVPVRLVMRRMECMYCYAPDKCTVLIENLFGLKVCATHKPNAVRDCKAYLHENNMVRLNDAFEHPIVSKFLFELKAFGTFSVERSDLTIQPGWKLRTDTESWDPLFLKCNDTSSWCVPTILKEGSTLITKHVPIMKFLDPSIHLASPKFLTLVEDTLDTLKEGVYRAEFDAFQEALEKDRVGSVAELEGVQTILYEGLPTRIYLPGTGLAPVPTLTTDPVGELD